MLRCVLGCLVMAAACGRIGYEPQARRQGPPGDGAADAVAELDVAPGMGPGQCGSGCTCAVRLGSRYAVCRMYSTWPEAALACSRRGMWLARVDDGAENVWVREAALSLGIRNLWIGGSDGEVEGEWRWLDGVLFWTGGRTGAPAGGLYSNWGVGEPNDASRGENCALMLTDSGRWNDGSCNSATMLPEFPAGFVCEGR
jgi:hypothetical protein